MPVSVTVAVRLTLAPAVAGLGVAVRTVVVVCVPVGGGVLGALDPPQPKSKDNPAKARSSGAARIEGIPRMTFFVAPNSM